MIEKKEIGNTDYGNNLFPVFLKLEDLRLLIIGGGNVALEKLRAVIQNSPATPVHMVSLTFQENIYEMVKAYSNITLEEKPYSASDLDNAQIVIAAVNDLETSKQIRDDAHQQGKLVNVADKPDLCDFYLGSIVRKGDLKIAISTNGKSPTIAKRVKEVISNMIPDEMEGVLNNMQTIREGIDGDFSEKVKRLNVITKVLVQNQTLQDFDNPGDRRF